MTDAPARPLAARRIAHIRDRGAALKRSVLSRINAGSDGNSPAFRSDSPEIRNVPPPNKHVTLDSVSCGHCTHLTQEAGPEPGPRVVRGAQIHVSCLGDHLCTCQSTPPPPPLPSYALVFGIWFLFLSRTNKRSPPRAVGFVQGREARNGPDVLVKRLSGYEFLGSAG